MHGCMGGSNKRDNGEVICKEGGLAREAYPACTFGNIRKGIIGTVHNSVVA